MSNPNDPRDASREKKLTPPTAWMKENVDFMNTSGMFFTGLIALTRNRYLAWPCLFLAISSIINYHPLRTKEGGNSPWFTLLMAVVALLTSYLPFFTVPVIAQLPVVQLQ